MHKIHRQIIDVASTPTILVNKTVVSNFRISETLFLLSWKHVYNSSSLSLLLFRHNNLVSNNLCLCSSQHSHASKQAFHPIFARRPMLKWVISLNSSFKIICTHVLSMISMITSFIKIVRLVSHMSKARLILSPSFLTQQIADFPGYVFYNASVSSK